MADIRERALSIATARTHNKLAVELGRDPAFDFGASRLVRNVANEALDLQTRVNHIFRIQGKMEWSAVSLNDLRAIIDRAEYVARTASEVLEAQEQEPTQLLQAAE